MTTLIPLERVEDSTNVQPIIINKLKIEQESKQKIIETRLT